MKLLRSFLFAIAVSLLLAPAANAVSASSETQVGDLISKATFGLGNNKAGGSGSLTVNVSHSLTSGAKQPPSSSIVIEVQKGSKLNTNVVLTCNLTTLENTGSCPSNTVLGSGTADARVDSGGIGTITAAVKVYKIANSNCSDIPSTKLCIALHADEPTTGVVTNIIVGASTKGGGVTLNAPSYSLPSVLGINPILISGKFVVNAKKTVKKNGKKTKLYVLTNPSKCNKTWTISETRNYEGFGEVSTATKIPCKKK